MALRAASHGRAELAGRLGEDLPRPVFAETPGAAEDPEVTRIRSALLADVVSAETPGAIACDVSAETPDAIARNVSAETPTAASPKQMVADESVERLIPAVAPSQG